MEKIYRLFSAIFSNNMELCDCIFLRLCHTFVSIFLVCELVGVLCCYFFTSCTSDTVK